MSKKKIFSIAVIAVVLIIGVAFFRSKVQLPFASKVNQSGENSTGNKVSVEVIKPTEMTQSPGSAYKSSLEAKQEGIVSSKNNGKVISILFDDGQKVTQGQELVILDDEDIKKQLKSAESQLEASKASLLGPEANLENAQRVYDRTKILVEQGAAAQADLDNAGTSLKSIQADIASSQASIKTAQTNIDNLNSQLTDMIIRAPFSGEIDSKNVSIGQYVSPSDVLGKVEDTSSINAVIEIDQSQIQNVKLGQKAKVIINEDTSKPYEGVVKNINTSADATSRSFQVKIGLINQSLSLRPGESVKVMLLDETKAQSFALPVALLAGNEGNYYVYINDKGIARKRAVTVKNLTDNQAEIKSGLNGKEEIIATNLNTLQDGDAITVVSK
ncbi:efflux RND transporter periplasmic adaptor subunit [Desulfosporosinus sp. SB140]|uniref:efflux RND transporter periplasmic adaptor subunit n=1 Tax=Desulfosporosinus paludis TaxID=3115649 RepID=UPI00388EBE9C